MKKPTETRRKQADPYSDRGGMSKPNRLYKSRLFEMLFSDRTELLKLYNAMNETNYDNPELLEINTLENAIYMSMRNDVSFIIDSRITLYEHQSTCSPNLPLRYLFYVSDLYSMGTRDENLYGSKSVRIPPPKFVVFFNGEEEQPERQVLRLSDMYTVEDGEPSLELTAVMLNINPGFNELLLESCRTLRDYSIYTARVRAYTKDQSLEGAVERAIIECIEEGILADFLKKHRLEAKKMSIYEYDEEKHMRQEREASKEEGIKEGKIQGEDKAFKLSKILLDAGRVEDLKRALGDKEFCEKLYKEFDII